MQSCNNNTGMLQIVKDTILTVNSGNTNSILVNLSFIKELLPLSVGFPPRIHDLPFKFFLI